MAKTDEVNRIKTARSYVESQLDALDVEAPFAQPTRDLLALLQSQSTLFDRAYDDDNSVQLNADMSRFDAYSEDTNNRLAYKLNHFIKTNSPNDQINRSNKQLAERINETTVILLQEMPAQHQQFEKYCTKRLQLLCQHGGVCRLKNDLLVGDTQYDASVAAAKEDLDNVLVCDSMETAIEYQEVRIV